MFKIPDNDVIDIINKLNNNGYEAYVVGGAVRDLILGLTPLDYDITTSALPNEIMSVFKENKVFFTGVKFGTVTLVYNNKNYEITTFRVDGDYIDNRKPKVVEFTNSLSEDLKRRDFTINSLALNNKLIDNHNGINDINNKVIKCIGDPNTRFEEDAIRILRAIKFSSKLNFSIDLNTEKAMFDNAYLLKKISIERINKELFKIFEYKNINIIDKYYNIFMIIFPHLTIEKKKIILNKLRNIDDVELIYACFFYKLDIEILRTELKKYKLSNEIYKIICLVNNDELVIEKNVIQCKKILKKHQKNDIILYIKYNVLNSYDINEFIGLLNIAEQECHKISMLAIDGNDLKSIGYNNTEIGKILNSILDFVIEDKIPNDRDFLLKYIKNKKRL